MASTPPLRSRIRRAGDGEAPTSDPAAAATATYLRADERDGGGGWAAGLKRSRSGGHLSAGAQADTAASASASAAAAGPSFRTRVEDTLAAAASSLTQSAVMDAAGIDKCEPLYCKCQQIAFGEMVDCSNPDCPVGWFHFSCVGLGRSTRPLDEWFCSVACRSAHARPRVHVSSGGSGGGSSAYKRGR